MTAAGRCGAAAEGPTPRTRPSAGPGWVPGEGRWRRPARREASPPAARGSRPLSCTGCPRRPPCVCWKTGKLHGNHAECIMRCSAVNALGKQTSTHLDAETPVTHKDTPKHAHPRECTNTPLNPSPTQRRTHPYEHTRIPTRTHTYTRTYRRTHARTPDSLVDRVEPLLDVGQTVGVAPIVVLLQLIIQRALPQHRTRAARRLGLRDARRRAGAGHLRGDPRRRRGGRRRLRRQGQRVRRGGGGRGRRRRARHVLGEVRDPVDAPDLGFGGRREFFEGQPLARCG